MVRLKWRWKAECNRICVVALCQIRDREESEKKNLNIEWNYITRLKPFIVQQRNVIFPLSRIKSIEKMRRKRVFYHVVHAHHRNKYWQNACANKNTHRRQAKWWRNQKISQDVDVEKKNFCIFVEQKANIDSVVDNEWSLHSILSPCRVLWIWTKKIEYRKCVGGGIFYSIT